MEKTIDEIRVAEAKLRRDLQLRNEGLVKALQQINVIAIDHNQPEIFKVGTEALIQYNQPVENDECRVVEGNQGTAFIGPAAIGEVHPPVFLLE